MVIMNNIRVKCVILTLFPLNQKSHYMRFFIMIRWQVHYIIIMIVSTRINYQNIYTEQCNFFENLLFINNFDFVLYFYFDGTL